MWPVVCFYKALFGVHGYFLIWSVTSVSQYLFLNYKKPIGLLLHLKAKASISTACSFDKAICMNSSLILWAFDLLFFMFLAVSLPPLFFILLFNVRITYRSFYHAGTSKSLCVSTLYGIAVMSGCELAHAITGSSFSSSSLFRLGHSQEQRCSVGFLG